MTSQILKNQPHFTRAVNAKTESEFLGLLKLVAHLYSEKAPGLDIGRLYGPGSVLVPAARPVSTRPKVEVLVGNLLPKLAPVPISPLRPSPLAGFPSNGRLHSSPPSQKTSEAGTEVVMAATRHATDPIPSAISPDFVPEELPCNEPIVLDDYCWPDLTQILLQDQDGVFHVSSLSHSPSPSLFSTPFSASNSSSSLHLGGLSMSQQFQPQQQLPIQLLRTQQATAEAHEAYLRLAQQGVEDLARAVALQSQLLSGMPVDLVPASTALPPAVSQALQERVITPSHGQNFLPSAPEARYSPFCDHNLEPIIPERRPCLMDYDQCMEFAVGSIGKVLGPMFAEVDNHSTRVRLPGDPLMLVHRITALEGEAGSLGAGRLVTEHDVQEGAWYLDNRRMPVCVTVEAGQADLFLSSYLGIDLKTKGQRVYRLLDATVSFHRQLPTVGETISYDIRIDRFVRQGETYLFFFEFDGTINGEPLITMRNGCAGFFTYEEIKANKGIILTAPELQRQVGKVTGGYRPLLPFASKESYNDHQVNCLRAGDLEGCFGSQFAGLGLARAPQLPSGRLKLFDRILEVDPVGGRFGLGSVRAEADVHPDDWFLTCHFVDDMVMPGTLMYECCAHTLRFLLWRMGWVGECDQITYEPLLNKGAVLKCRGPVDVTSKKVVYEVEIKEVGYGPEPYVICDALMYADGKCIVRFVDMSLRVIGLDQAQLESRWGVSNAGALTSSPTTPAPAGKESRIKRAPLYRSDTGVTYDAQSIYEFAQGRPSLAFGAPYKIFDEGDRRLARLPRAPFSFVDRIVEIAPEPFVLQPTEWIEAQYDIPWGEWYFAANRQRTVPFAVLLETALQPCGWLAAYCGSGLRSDQNLRFRNLGGKAILHREVYDTNSTLAIRVRMPQVSEAGGMIIENFDMEMFDEDGMIYEGTTYFGFFTEAALANQVGIRDAKRYIPSESERARGRRLALPKVHPHDPTDRQQDAGTSACMPGQAFLMIDEVDLYVPDGGPKGLGYLHGIKAVDPAEWFFQAHFYQDPVCPGSLGLEAFLQLLKVACLEKFPQYADTHRFEAIATGLHHSWGYRGQIIPKNHQVQVEAYLTHVHDDGQVLIKADGFLLVDGKPIYSMEDFAMRMVRG